MQHNQPIRPLVFHSGQEVLNLGDTARVGSVLGGLAPQLNPQFGFSMNGNPGNPLDFSSLGSLNSVRAQLAKEFGQGHPGFAAMGKDASSVDDGGSRPSRGPTRSQDSRGSGAYASRHQAAEQRRRLRINERLELLRKLVPHVERSNTACFLEEVIKYIDSLRRRVSELEVVLGGTGQSQPVEGDNAQRADPKQQLQNPQQMLGGGQSHSSPRPLDFQSLTQLNGNLQALKQAQEMLEYNKNFNKLLTSSGLQGLQQPKNSTSPSLLQQAQFAGFLPTADASLHQAQFDLTRAQLTDLATQLGLATACSAAPLITGSPRNDRNGDARIDLPAKRLRTLSTDTAGDVSGGTVVVQPEFSAELAASMPSSLEEVGPAAGKTRRSLIL